MSIFAAHNGIFACDRCWVEGKNINNRTIFTTINDKKRTDESFRNFENPEHHTGKTPLVNLRLPFNMIKQFSLDFMHLCCLGVMRKLLNECWLSNDTGTRISKINILKLTQRMTNLNTQIPKEFQRQFTQPLGLVSRWKATELRFFLLYCGPLVLKNLLPKNHYEHFLHLFVALRILCCQKMINNNYVDHAEIYLKRFVLLCGKYYKLESMVLNVHSLIHLVDEVRYFKCTLSKLTAFPFENELGNIKKRLRSGYKALHQYCSRLTEEFSLNFKKESLPPILEIITSSKSIVENKLIVTSIKYKEFFYTIKKPNNCVMLNNGDFCLINKMESHEKNKIIFYGKKLNLIGEAFESPTKASDLYIHKVSEINTHCLSVKFFLEDICKKAIFFKIFEIEDDDEKEFYVIPMLH